MDKENARMQTLLELHTRRKQVVRLHRKGLGVMQIVQLSGLSWPAVRAALTLFEQGGWNALKPKARGKESGTGRALTREQEHRIRGIICDKRPEQVKMDFALWNRGAVTILIERECGLKLTIRAVGNYLKRWGMTPQKPIKRAYEQKPEAVKAWLDEQYPAIEARAKPERAEIHWGDETAVVNTDVRGRCYAPRGQTPVAYAVGGTRQKLSMISTVTNQGKARWMIIDENFNADKLIEFLAALIKDAKKKVFLILDNLRVHHSKAVKAWLEEHKAKIEVFYLPSYSPQLNPDERLNADLKYALGSTVAMRTKSTLWNATAEYMTMLEKSPERVKSYFQDPRVQYAA
ncbi:IS630 family transposase [Undibacterium arcticum]|uniref:IS630 family transposase n=1 Tax=Undibacterium arcticum TaxID=1762892 RepID=A0ABV7EYR1_9BURK